MGNKALALMGVGIGPEKAVIIETDITTRQQLTSCSDGLTAAGTIITDALDLVSISNCVTTAAASTGVQLPVVDTGAKIEIRNSGANTMNVFPDSSSNNINGGSAGAAVTMATNTSLTLRKVSTTKWITV